MNSNKIRRKTDYPPLVSVRLLDQLRERIRYRHYSLSTERTYVQWVRSFVDFHKLRHPREMGKPEVGAFLTWLAAERRVSASTHRQALSALLFLYGEVLGVALPWLDGISRPRQVKRLPVVLSADEVRRIFRFMDGEHLLMAQLLYGTGLRLMEAMRLRVKDIDFTRNTIIVREAKGNKDRAVMLPKTRRFSAASSARLNVRASPNRQRRIRCATVLRRICCNSVTTSAPCRNCWVIRM
jgi:integrase